MTSPRGLGRTLIVAILTLVVTRSARSQVPWIEARFAHYSIFYQPGFESDVRSVQGWADAAERLMQEKYGVQPRHYRMGIYLFPVPTVDIDVSHARNVCCTPGAGSDSIGRIEMLAPCSRAMRATVELSSLRIPKNDSSYHAKVLMSEYIPIGHYEVQNGRPVGGWRYYDAPNWFVQGLQEFDAIFHTTTHNRTETAQRLLDWARSHTSVFACCDPDLKISDDYNGGATFMLFLAAQFGEGIHLRLLQDTSATFAGALTAVTRPYTRSQLFTRLQNWLRAPPLPESPPNKRLKLPGAHK